MNDINDVLEALNRTDLAPVFEGSAVDAAQNMTSAQLAAVGIGEPETQQRFQLYCAKASADNAKQQAGTVLDPLAKRRLDGNPLGQEHDAWTKEAMKPFWSFNIFEQFFFGLRLPILANEYLKRNPDLRKKMKTPILMWTGIFIVINILLYFILSALIVSGILFFFAYLAGMYISVWVTHKAFGPVAGGFLESICDTIEDREKKGLYSTWEDPVLTKKWTRKATVQGMIHGVFFIVTLGIGPKLILWCIPGIGQLVDLVFVAMIPTWEMSFDFMASVRGWTFKEKLLFIRRYFPMFCGLVCWTGAAVSIPILLPFLVGPAVVGGSLCLIWMEAEYKFQPPDRRPRPSRSA